jgi:hypothetical protein
MFLSGHRLEVTHPPASPRVARKRAPTLGGACGYFSAAERDSDDPMRWRLIEAHCSRRLPNGERIRASRRNKGERGIWQRRFWEYPNRDDLHGMIWIDSGMSTLCMTIRSSRVMSNAPSIAGFHPFTGIFSLGDGRMGLCG